MPRASPALPTSQWHYAAIGYTKEIRVGRIWADLRGNEMGGGTTEIMDYIAGRQLVKKYKAK